MKSTASRTKPMVRTWPAPKFPLVLDAEDFFAAQTGGPPDRRPKSFVQTLESIIHARDNHEALGYGLLDDCDIETMVRVMLERISDGTHRNDRIAFAIARELDLRFPIRLPSLAGGAA